MKVIAWDLDDVLHPWYHTAHLACVAAGIAPDGVYPSTWYPYLEYGCSDQDWFDALAAATKDGTLYGGEPTEEVRSIFEEFHELGYRQEIVTARGFMAHGDEIRTQTLQWLKPLSGFYETVNFSRDKAMTAVTLGITHAIDDNLQNYYDYDNIGVQVYLMDQAWNRDTDGPVRRVLDLGEFRQAIIEGGTA